MPSTILLGTNDGLYQLGREKPVLEGAEVTALEQKDSGILALVNRSQLRPLDSHGSPRNKTASLSLDSLEAKCLLPASDGVFVGTSEARLFLWRQEGLKPVKSFDQAPDRDEWYTPWGGPPDVRSMTRSSEGAIYVNVHVGGILRSRDDAASWEPTIDIDVDVHQVLFDSSRGWLWAATAEGLALSKDMGDSWQFETEGLHDTYCRAVAVAGETVIVTASTGPSEHRAAVYRRPLAGNGPLLRCGDGLPEWFPSNINTHCLVARGARATFGTAEGEVFVSSDEGRSWEKAAEGLPKIRSVLMVS